MDFKENFKTMDYLDLIVAPKCDKCDSNDSVFLRSEPVFDDNLGTRQSKLREVYECRNCGEELIVEKAIENEEYLF